MRKSDENAIARTGKKQTYFVKPTNIEKLKKIKTETKQGYSETINRLIEQEHEKILKENNNE